METAEVRAMLKIRLLTGVLLLGFAALPLLGQATAPAKVGQQGAPEAATEQHASQQPSIVPIPYADQINYLQGLMGPKRRHVEIDATLIFNGLASHVEGVACSGGVSGTATSYAGSDLYFGAATYSLCREVRSKNGIVVLGLRDPDWPQTAHLIFIACDSGYSKRQTITALATLGYGAIFEHPNRCFLQEGRTERAVLSREKKGGWEVYIGARPALGRKVRVAKFTVIEVRLAKIGAAAAGVR